MVNRFHHEKCVRAISISPYQHFFRFHIDKWNKIRKNHFDEKKEKMPHIKWELVTNWVWKQRNHFFGCLCKRNAQEKRMNP